MMPNYEGQAGRRFIVTGGTSGLGLEMVRALATAGADVVLAARDLERGAAAAERVRRTGAEGRVEVRHLDVCDLASVREFAAGVDRVDVLINNAGVMGTPLQRTAAGFELQFATNHLGPFALTNLLLPVLTDRVVAVGSFAHLHGRPVLDDLNFERRRYRRYPGYAQSKLAQVSFIGELARRLDAVGSTVRSVGGHPGFSATAITAGTGLPAFTRFGQLGNLLVGMKPSKGALPILCAATLDLPSGTYVGPDGFLELFGHPTVVGRSRRASDPRLGEELWKRSEELTGVSFPL